MPLDESIKNRLFELIREEKVIIFAGAGTSIEVGYPSGNMLRNILYDNLTHNEKLLIDKNLPLDKFSNEFCMIKNDDRKSLYNILLNQFKFIKIKKSKFHKTLSSISQIKTIITTNYDKLFEESYGSKCEVIFKAKHLSNKKNNVQTYIYKIHGDISELESIIITSEDYNKFFQNHKNESIIWSDVVTKMASNHVLFIGYSLEDPNINILFDKIYEELKNNNKEHFLISPNIHQHRIDNLNKKNISCIQMKASEFIYQLKKNIDSNVVDDFHSQKLSIDTFMKYSKNQGLFPKIVLNSDRKTIIDDFEILNKKPIKKILNIEIAGNFYKDFFDYTNSKSINSLEITEDRILNSSIKFGDIVFKKNDLLKLQVTPIPKIETLIDIKFKNGVELYEIPVKYFNKPRYGEVQIKLKNSALDLKFDFDNDSFTEFKLVHTHNKLCGNLKSEIEEMEMIKSLADGISFDVYPKGYSPIKNLAISGPDILQYTFFNIDFFNNLKLIENHFDIVFDKIEFDSIDDVKHNLSKIIVSSFKNEITELDWNGELKIDLIKAKIELENAEEILLDENYKCIYPAKDEEIIELYNYKINLGFRLTELVDPYIENLEKIKEKSQSVIIFKSKKKKVNVIWT